MLDFGAGSGLQGIAALKAGAASVLASEVDCFACAAVGLNAEANGVEIELVEEDLIGRTDSDWEVILAGDVCYEGPMAARIDAWLKGLARDGRRVLLGDPGRTYLPKEGLERLVAYGVKTSRELEDSDLRNAVVWQVL